MKDENSIEFIEEEIVCLKRAEDYCHTRAAMACELQKEGWRRKAQINRDHREKQEKLLQNLKQKKGQT